MKKSLTAALTLLFACLPMILWSQTEEKKVGDMGPAGGIIFYDKGSYSDGWRYLEAAPSDQTDQNGIQWQRGDRSDIDINTGTVVGTGKANTDAIILAQGNGDYAASLCKNLTINGISDWFLPSKDELYLMYVNLKKAGLGGLVDDWYWSSSQGSDRTIGGIGAWGGDFSERHESYGTEYQTVHGRANRFVVRACREF